jgi:hypothetical protein
MEQRRRATSEPTAVVPFASLVGGACVLNLNRQIKKEECKTIARKKRRGQGEGQEYGAEKEGNL